MGTDIYHFDPPDNYRTHHHVDIDDYADVNGWFDNNSGFVDHQPHHNDGAHINDDGSLDDVDRAAIDNRRLDDLRRHFIDQLANYWAGDSANYSATDAAAAALIAELARNRQQ